MESQREPGAEDKLLDLMAERLFDRLRPRIAEMLADNDARRGPALKDDPWLTVKDVAELTGKHVNTIRDALHRGDLKGARGPGGGGKGKGWRIRASAVTRYMGG